MTRRWFARLKSCLYRDYLSSQLEEGHGSLVEIRIVLSPKYKSTYTNSVVSVHKRTIPTERPPLVGEVSAHFC
jgi:hypothetical protein